MRQNGRHVHHDWHQVPNIVSGRRYIGSVSEWRLLLIAFERFRRIEMLDHAEALYLLSDLILRRKERMPVACIDNIVRNGVPEIGIFLDVSLLRNLASGCRELLLMARHDRFGAFRGTLCDGWPSKHGPEPLLSDDEDRAVRSLARKVISFVENDAGLLLES